MKDLLKNKYNEAIRLSQDIDALEPIMQIDRYRYTYDKTAVNELINRLTLWQNEVKYILQNRIGEKHSAYIDFINTITRKNTGFDYKEELRNELEAGRTQLWAIIESLSEILPAKEANKNDLNDIWQIMHPEIIRISKSRFESGFYADAVVSAFKEINVKVRELYKQKTGDDRDGANLMLTAFSVKNPVLKFKSSSSYSDNDVQEGYMHMFAGAMKGIRNPKSHENETITKEDALRKLAFASMLMYKLDNVEK